MPGFWRLRHSMCEKRKATSCRPPGHGIPVQPVLAKSWSPRSSQAPLTQAKVLGGVTPSAYPRRRILSSMPPIPLG
eukprot:2217741-Heterocapsa_arctica.AAC.1